MTVSRLLLIFSSVLGNSFTSITEFAEYTSAQERIALGKKSRKLEASKRRNEMQELIADAT
jgi:hypothetical protein